MLNRRQILAGVSASALIAACFPATNSNNAVDLTAADLPNIVLIVMDQERALGTLPDGLELPVRRQFAAQSANFTNFHVNSVPCAPSRAIIWTGQHTQKNGVIANPGHAGSQSLSNEKTPPIQTLLKSYGYTTALKGKWHLSDLSHLGGKGGLGALQFIGLDEWQEDGDTFGRTLEASTRDQEIADQAVEYIERQSNSDKPWFLNVNFIHPHDVMWYDATGNQEETRLSKGYVSEMAGAPDRAPFTDDLGFELPKSFHANNSEWPYAHKAYKEINDVFYGVLPDDEAAYRRVQNFYFNCLKDSERTLGQVLSAVANSPQADNTIIILTSDHGEMAGAHKQRNKGPFMFKENLNVPLMINDPRSSFKGEHNAVCCSLDLAPTILSLIGLTDTQINQSYPDLKGVSLRPFINGQAADEAGRGVDDRGILLQFNSLTHTNPRIFAERILEKASAKKNGTAPAKRTWPDDEVQFEIRGFGRGIFDGRYKFARWFSPADHHTPVDWHDLIARNDLELIDTLNDPSETINLAADLKANKKLIMLMNEKLNALIAREVGEDDGQYLPGNHAYFNVEAEL